VIALRDRPRLACEEEWMVEEASFSVSKVNSGYFKLSSYFSTDSYCSPKPNEKINDSADIVLDSFQLELVPMACFSRSWLLWRVSVGSGTCGVFCFSGNWLLWRVSVGSGSYGVFKWEVAPVAFFSGNWLLWRVSAGTGSCGVYQRELAPGACFSGR
jgi:hypothetical protein